VSDITVQIVSSGTTYYPQGVSGTYTNRANTTGGFKLLVPGESVPTASYAVGARVDIYRDGTLEYQGEVGKVTRKDDRKLEVAGEMYGPRLLKSLSRGKVVHDAVTVLQTLKGYTDVQFIVSVLSTDDTITINNTAGTDLPAMDIYGIKDDDTFHYHRMAAPGSSTHTISTVTWKELYIISADSNLTSYTQITESTSGDLLGFFVNGESEMHAVDSDGYFANGLMFKSGIKVAASNVDANGNTISISQTWDRIPYLTRLRALCEEAGKFYYFDYRDGDNYLLMENKIASQTVLIWDSGNWDEKVWAPGCGAKEPWTEGFNCTQVTRERDTSRIINQATIVSAVTSTVVSGSYADSTSQTDYGVKNVIQQTFNPNIDSSAACTEKARALVDELKDPVDVYKFMPLDSATPLQILYPLTLYSDSVNKSAGISLKIIAITRRVPDGVITVECVGDSYSTSMPTVPGVLTAQKDDLDKSMSQV